MSSTRTARVAPEKTVPPAGPAAAFLFAGFAEKQMGMTYREQLRHPEWQKRRLHMLEAAGWACARCHDKETMLHVHHKHYVKGRMAWEYTDIELEVVCEDCHSYEHEAGPDKLQQVVFRIPFDFRGDAAEILANWWPGSEMADLHEAQGDVSWHALQGRILGCLWRIQRLDRERLAHFLQQLEKQGAEEFTLKLVPLDEWEARKVSSRTPGGGLA